MLVQLNKNPNTPYIPMNASWSEYGILKDLDVYRQQKSMKRGITFQASMANSNEDLLHSALAFEGKVYGGPIRCT
jgi:hypothetical protein